MKYFEINFIQEQNCFSIKEMTKTAGNNCYITKVYYKIFLNEEIYFN